MIEPHLLIGLSLEEAERKIQAPATIRVALKDNVGLGLILDGHDPTRYNVTITNQIIQTCSIG